MLSIGAFARHGGVSIRMLRHYDAIGLLRPARIDSSTGYRWYGAAQLARLNRIVALKDLGFTLDAVRSIVDDELSADELRGMLRLRRGELGARIADDEHRLARVEARLRIIEGEGAMPAEVVDLQVKALPAVRVAELTGRAEGFAPAAIGPVIRPLYGEVQARLRGAGAAPAGPAVAYYEDDPDGVGVVVHASVPVAVETDELDGLAVIDLPAVERAVALVHHGAMDDVLPSVQLLARWIEVGGERSAAYPREVYLQCDEAGEPFVVELQEPLARWGAHREWTSGFSPPLPRPS